jgi:hypothetical protein
MVRFQPSLSLAQRVAEASPSFAWEIQARGAMKDAEQMPALDGDKAREVLGEQIIGRVAMLARDRACARPGRIIPFVERSGTLNRDWETGFFGYLKITPSSKAAEDIRTLLIRDLTEWVKSHGEDAGEIGLSLGSKGELLRLLCRPLKPVLEPAD